jgi:phosphoesterase RecJ-like protein
MDSEKRTKRIKAVSEWLRTHEDIAVITHVSPDGDALGSALALVHALRAMGKRAFVCDEHPVPNYLRLLPGSHEVFTPDNLPFEPRAVISVDCSEEARAGAASALLKLGLPAALIDHHETNTADFETALIDGKESATGVLIYEVLKALDIPFTREIAQCLYVSISTDTDNFSFGSTTPEAFIAVSDCLRAGLDIADFSFRLFRMKSAPRTRLLGRALNGIQYLADGRLAMIRVTLRDLEECGANSSDTEGIVNFGIDTEGVEISVLATEKTDGVKFSLRSKGKINVARAIGILGGGGHAQAAGATLHVPMEEGIEMLLSVLLPML